MASAGSLSRFKGGVNEILAISEGKSLEQNTEYARNVMGIGHYSISDHDYLVLAIKDVVPIIEQIIIGERYASFTIKFRREVDFSRVGYYVSKFRDSKGNYIGDSDLYDEYKDYMDALFKNYSLVEHIYFIHFFFYILSKNYYLLHVHS